MRILVFSDSHEREDSLERVFRKESFDYCICLGDTHDRTMEIELLLHEYKPRVPIRFVRGNCDNDIGISDEAQASYGDVRIYSTHGNRFYGPSRLTDLALRAAACNCSIALHGHTHLPALDVRNGVYLMNPGSIGLPRQEDHKPSYGLILLTHGKEPEFLLKRADDV